MKALVCRGAGEPLRVEEVTLPAPGEREVRVRIRAAGICHSDLSMVNGTLDPPFPLILGHEAAGEVVELGPGACAELGSHVVLNWAPPCRECWFCEHEQPWLCETGGSPAAPRGLTAEGEQLHVTLGLGALAEEVVVPDHAVIPVPPELPFAQAALLGCAVLTGVGAVRRTAHVAPGESVVVIGLGGVGLSAVQAARAARARQVIAIDVSAAKRELALAMGATDFLLAGDRMGRTIKRMTGGRGADQVFECVGQAATIHAAWRMARRGGQVTVVGMGGKNDLLTLSALEIFHSARTLRSSVYGSSDPDYDLPFLAEAVRDGTLDISPLITAELSLDEAPGAFAAMARGEGARSVVVFD